MLKHLVSYFLDNFRYKVAREIPNHLAASLTLPLHCFREVEISFSISTSIFPFNFLPNELHDWSVAVLQRYDILLEVLQGLYSHRPHSLRRHKVKHF